MAIRIPYSVYNRFNHPVNASERLGVHFYRYMKLDEYTSPFDKIWCDKLLTTTDHIARQMILSMVYHD